MPRLRPEEVHARMSRHLAIALSFSLLAAANASAQTGTTSPIHSGVDVVTASAYVWRGFVPVSRPSVQPNSWIKVGNLTASSWLNIDSSGPFGRRLTEHDFTLDYSVTSHGATLSAGYINYVFPDASTEKMSHEMYASIAGAGYFNPSIRVFQDVKYGSGTYGAVAVAHTYRAANVDLTPSVAVAYNHHQWIDASTWSDVNIGLKASLPPLWSRVTVSPFINLSRSLAPELLPNRVYGGLSLSIKK